MEPTKKLQNDIKISWSLYLVLGILLVLIAVICVILLLKKPKKRNVSNIKTEEQIELSGRIMVTIEDEESGTSFPPIVRELEHYNSGVSIIKIVPELSEYRDVGKIRIISDRMNLYSFKALQAQKNKEKVTYIKAGDKRRINLTGTSRTLFVEYLQE